MPPDFQKLITMAETNKKLFAEFPPVSTQEWEEKIVADLKGKDYEKALVWRTNEGFNVRPYYREENLEGLDFRNSSPGEFPYVRGTKTSGNDWYIRQDIVVDDLAAANQKALALLGKGVNALGFVFECCKNLTRTDLELLLKDICLEAIEVNFVCPCAQCNITDLFVEMVSNGKWDPSKVTASVTVDPLATFLVKGKFEEGSEAAAFVSVKNQVEKAVQLPRLRVITVQGKLFGNSGASIVQELAFALAQGNEYLARLTEAGLSIDTVAQKVKFNFSISNNYFLEIAKLRAARLLWAQVVKTYGPACDCSAKMVAHCETGTFNKTVYDPYVNMLRTQTEAMSAVLGGADSITVMPFDAVFRQPGEFSERIARNQQILLKEESHFDKIADPAGGSYYIETLTASVAQQAWKLFLEIEDKGGFTAALREGFIQKQVKEMAARRDQNIALRRENLLGINQFPNFTESIREKIDESVFNPQDFTAPGAEVETLKPFRVGQAFETLRYKTDVFAQSNKRPVAFMLTMGNLAMRKARAQFSCNFFAVAGFEVIDNNGFETVEEGLAAARAAQADIVVVCSSDEEYAEIVPAVAAQIGNEILVVAGNPVCRPELEAAGVKNFIHMKSNLLEELKAYQNQMF